MSLEVLSESAIQGSESSIARRFFAKASVSFPASATAQGAMVAKLCNENRIEPKTLGESLVASRRDLELLETAANNLHKSHNSDIEINVDRVVAIAKVVFQKARMYSQLDQRDLDRILGEYAHYHDENDEFGYAAFAYDIVLMHREGDSTDLDWLIGIGS